MIHFKVKRGIRIRIKVTRIRHPATSFYSELLDSENKILEDLKSPALGQAWMRAPPTPRIITEMEI
jgi:hypothetical protein